MQKPNDETFFSKEREEEVKERFKKEMERVREDLVAVANRSNVFFGIRASYYGPNLLLMVGSYLPFFIFHNSFDIINLIFSILFMICTHRMMKYSYDELDGDNGRIDFYGEQSKKLAKAREDGIVINDNDVGKQSEWLQKLKTVYKLPDENTFTARIGGIRDKIQKYRKYITILIPCLIFSFLIKKLPWETDSNTVSNTDAEKITWSNFFAPNYIQYIYSLSPVAFSIISISIVVIAIIVVWYLKLPNASSTKF